MSARAFFIAAILGLAHSAAAEATRPNVLFIAMDDLNDWIGVMGGHPQARTPNLDRLARSGVLFTNAHCPAPACNPSRTAIFTGRSPHRSGLYTNRQKMRDVLPEAEIIPKVFTRHGYHSSGSGKLLHYFIDAQSWDDYFPETTKENPFPRTLYPEKRPLSLPVGGPWQYVETDWGPLDATDEEYGDDLRMTDRARPAGPLSGERCLSLSQNSMNHVFGRVLHRSIVKSASPLRDDGHAPRSLNHRTTTASF